MPITALKLKKISASKNALTREIDISVLCDVERRRNEHHVEFTEEFHKFYLNDFDYRPDVPVTLIYADPKGMREVRRFTSQILTLDMHQLETGLAVTIEDYLSSRHLIPIMDELKEI